MKSFNLPDLGEGLAQATVREWHAPLNATIKKGQSLVSVETAKALVEIPSPYTGQLIQQCAAVGDIVQTGAPLATLQTHLTDKANTVVGQLENQSVLSEMPALPPLIQSDTTTVIAQPAARHLAHQLNIPLDSIKGSGPNKLITVSDIVMTHQKTIPPKPSLDPYLSGVRQQMAYKLEQTHHSTAPTTLTEVIDISAWYKKTRLFPYVINCLTKVLMQHPALNAHYIPYQEYTRFDQTIHLGIAIQTPHGLLVPVIQSVESLSIQSLNQQLQYMKTQAQHQNLNLNQTLKPTFILSNIGALGIGRFATPMLTPPAVATLALGAVYTGPTLSHEQRWAMHPYLPISLTFDHRVVYGAEAAHLIKGLKLALEAAHPT